MRKLKSLLQGSMLAMGALFAGVAGADSYPSRPIQIIVPTGAGSIADVSVRIVATKWSEFLGQPVIVVNRPGSGGVIATNSVTRAAPDGYTLFAAYDSITVALPFVQKTVDYDIDSFTYLTGFGTSSIYFMVRADSPYGSMKDFIEAAKKNPGKMAYSSYGVGVIAHFAAQRLWDLSGADLLYVPYKSSPDAAAALLSKDVQMAVTAGGKVLGNNPNVRFIGVAADQRRTDFPDIPTLKEQGYPVSMEWIVALIGPRGLPEEVVKKLTAAIQAADAKYGDQFREQLPKSGDLTYANIPGAEVYKAWKERQEWFKETARNMKLDN